MNDTASAYMAVYPNPVSTQLFLLDEPEGVSYEIYDQSGSRKLTGTYTDTGNLISSGSAGPVCKHR